MAQAIRAQAAVSWGVYMASSATENAPPIASPAVAAVGHEDSAIAGQEQQQVEAAVDDGGLPAGRGGKEEAGRRQDDQAGVEEDQVAAPAVEQWVPGAFLEGGQNLIEDQADQR
ncbi:hypothetical protein ACFXA0_13350 [Streptomyces cyaneofuscatus]|uniref:hypothetical protein n=1 Tax=Streptomyces TaxID=1883 RepID=UPI00136E6882|nr:hypothetical protein [Streptomyces sp. SID2119]MYW30798.1 hypothetical protein [Streptomyces sp. SID2119]